MTTTEQLLASLRELASAPTRVGDAARGLLTRIEAKAELDERMGVATAHKSVIVHTPHATMFKAMTAEQARAHCKARGLL